jgi:hypothetical protein
LALPGGILSAAILIQSRLVSADPGAMAGPLSLLVGAVALETVRLQDGQHVLVEIACGRLRLVGGVYREQETQRGKHGEPDGARIDKSHDRVSSLGAFAAGSGQGRARQVV